MGGGCTSRCRPTFERSAPHCHGAERLTETKGVSRLRRGGSSPGRTCQEAGGRLSALTETQAPRATKWSAAAACLASSRVMRRSRTLVSIARISRSHSLADALLQFREGTLLRRSVGEERLVNIQRGELAPASHDDRVSFNFPLNNRPRPHAQSPPDFGGHGNLTLSGELGMSESHASYYHGNLPARPSAKGVRSCHYRVRSTVAASGCAGPAARCPARPRSSRSRTPPRRAGW